MLLNCGVWAYLKNFIAVISVFVSTVQMGRFESSLMCFKTVWKILVFAFVSFSLCVFPHVGSQASWCTSLFLMRWKDLLAI